VKENKNLCCAHIYSFQHGLVPCEQVATTAVGGKCLCKKHAAAVTRSDDQAETSRRGAEGGAPVSYTAADIHRRNSGKLAKRAGEDFESRLALEHRMYFAAKRAVIGKVAEPNKIIRKGRALIRVGTGQAPIDFQGHLWGSGRAVYMEAKSNVHANETSLPIGDKVRPEQLRALCDNHESGALIALTWCVGYPAGVVGVLGAAGIVEAWRKYQAGERSSIPRDAFEWLAAGSTDWLPVAKRLGGVA